MGMGGRFASHPDPCQPAHGQGMVGDRRRISPWSGPISEVILIENDTVGPEPLIPHSCDAIYNCIRHLQEARPCERQPKCS